jgi:acetylornithine/succinyldiaminopimelate/putrescine aminotransferase
MDTIKLPPNAPTFCGGDGPELFTGTGERYLDFFCDVGTASLGYSEPWAALGRLVDNRIPVHAPNRYAFKTRTDVAAELCKVVGMDKVFFCNSGTEAVEAAIKCARLRQFQRSGSAGDDNLRYEVWAYRKGFHGRTYGALAAGDGPVYHYTGFGPHLQGFRHFTDISELSAKAAAVILSPVFANGDVNELGGSYLYQLRDFCDRNDIALIFDEVQTGSGRCGGDAFTYAQRVGVRPDIVTLAKGVAMGAPVGAMLARGDYANAFTVGSHFSTFGGNPFSCSMVEGMLSWWKKNREAAEDIGKILRGSLRAIPGFRNVRGPGALIAFDYDRPMALAEAALNQHLLIGVFHDGPGPVKLTPPLNITHSMLKTGIERLERAHIAVQTSTKKENGHG